MGIGYVIKLIFKPARTQSASPAKYTSSNIQKALDSSLMQNNISPNRTLVEAYLTKYSVVGTVVNPNKCYLLK